ncbi:MAG: hypothetical protein QXZ28_05780 [Candidatus Methanomethylicaceae archaeon]
MKFLSYTDLLSVWRKGVRNGLVRRLSLIEKGLFRAALCYSKMKGKIVNSLLIKMLNGIAERVSKSLRQRIFEHGIERAWVMLSGKCCKIFPIVRKWINDDIYILWLGTEILTSKRSWLI